MTKGEGGAGILYPTYYAEPGDGFDAARFDFYRFRRDASRASAVRSLFRHSSSTVVAVIVPGEAVDILDRGADGPRGGRWTRRGDRAVVRSLLLLKQTREREGRRVGGVRR